MLCYADSFIYICTRFKKKTGDNPVKKGIRLRLFTGFFLGNLDENRVEFTQGRDLKLENYKNGLVNFFIYPLMEEDGKTSTKYSKEFSYREI